MRTTIWQYAQDPISSLTSLTTCKAQMKFLTKTMPGIFFNCLVELEMLDLDSILNLYPTTDTILITTFWSCKTGAPAEHRESKLNLWERETWYHWGWGCASFHLEIDTIYELFWLERLIDDILFQIKCVYLSFWLPYNVHRNMWHLTYIHAHKDLYVPVLL